LLLADAEPLLQLPIPNDEQFNHILQLGIEAFQQKPSTVTRDQSSVEELISNADRRLERELADADAAYKRGDYATALRLLRPLAELLDLAQAQSNLGVMYDEGHGVPQDDAEAVKWYRLAAEQGYADAQLNLGAKYAVGKAVPQDYAEAVKWFRLAAEQGYANAQHNLGVMYTKGQGVPQDYAAAAKWFRLAAEQGDAQAQYNLGVMYDEGHGVPQDYVQALKWFNLAASRFSASEAGDRDKAVKDRDLVASRMTPAQIAEAQKLAREWKPK